MPNTVYYNLRWYTGPTCQKRNFLVYSQILAHAVKKCKRDEASLIHMYWSCPSMGKFWKEVFQTLSTVLNLDLTPDPLIALFGITRRDDPHLTSYKYHALSFASLLARRAVLLRWRDAASPTHAQWLGDVMSCLSLEKIRYSIHNSYKKFLNVWGPFLKHFKSLST